MQSFTGIWLPGRDWCNISRWYSFLYISYLVNKKHSIIIKFNILGKRVAIGYEDGVVRILDLKTNSVLSFISSTYGHSHTITTIDCHSDNNLILSAAVDGKTIISTSNTGKVIKLIVLVQQTN